VNENAKLGTQTTVVTKKQSKKSRGNSRNNHFPIILIENILGDFQGHFINLVWKLL
jgi:hypothetical protein